MKTEIYEMMMNLHSMLTEAEKRFKELNDKNATWAWRFDDMKMAEHLFAKATSNIEQLESFFLDGDELLTAEEQERLEREHLEELVAEELLEG